MRFGLTVPDTSIAGKVPDASSRNSAGGEMNLGSKATDPPS